MSKYKLPKELIDDIAWYASNALDYMVPEAMPSSAFAERCQFDGVALTDRLRRLAAYLDSENSELLDHVNEQINNWSPEKE
jgi:hypothetical protein